MAQEECTSERTTMGVETNGNTEGDHPVELRFTSCERNYWTDEEMMNDCPYCGSHYDWEIIDE